MELISNRTFTQKNIDEVCNLFKEGANFRYCLFNNIELRNNKTICNCNFRSCSFDHCVLNDTYWKNCTFDLGSMSYCELVDSTFMSCNMNGTDYRVCRLTYSAFSGKTEVLNSTFDDCNMEQVRVGLHVVIKETNFDECSLISSMFRCSVRRHVTLKSLT